MPKHHPLNTPQPPRPTMQPPTVQPPAQQQQGMAPQLDAAAMGSLNDSGFARCGPARGDILLNTLWRALPSHSRRSRAPLRLRLPALERLWARLDTCCGNRSPQHGFT